MEIWKPIPGYEDRYEASSEGRIRRLPTRNRRGVYLGAYTGSGGYLRCAIRVDGRMRQKGVHQLVALAFLGLCPKGHEVNHKNLDKTDNRPENLEYMSHTENIKHARQQGRWDRDRAKGERRSRAKLNEHQVREIKQSLSEGVSECSLAEKHKVSQQAIYLIKAGKTWKYIPAPIVR